MATSKNSTHVSIPLVVKRKLKKIAEKEDRQMTTVLKRLIEAEYAKL